MSDFPVWVAEPAEAADVARLLIAFRDDLGYDWPSDNAFLAGVEKLIEDRKGTVFLLGSTDPDTPPAAVAQLRFRHGLWRAGPDCLLEDLYVKPQARGRGLGRQVTEFALEFARETRGARRMELDVNEANENALKLYESLGFGVKNRHGGRDLYLRVHLED